MHESPQSGFERAVRKVCWWIIGIFVFLGVVPFVGMTLFEAFARARGPFPWREMLPGCAAMCGPFLLWIALAAMYFRAPRELRSIYFGDFGQRWRSSGRYYFDGISQFFSGYRKRFGIDVWFGLMLIAIPWSVIVIVAVVVSFSQTRQ
jgi:uncharacterized membrane protein